MPENPPNLPIVLTLVQFGNHTTQYEVTPAAPAFRSQQLYEVCTFAIQIVRTDRRRPSHYASDVLGYLKSLTYTFERDDRQISCVLIYAEPDPENPEILLPVTAEDTGFEGIACVDDTARAALLALDVYEQTRSRFALAQARAWLTFVTYMQYPDGRFANFIRNASGTRNATGQTSLPGGYWWSMRALWALARAYRLTGDRDYLDQYEACHLEPIPDGKIRALMALTDLELYRAMPSTEVRDSILEHCAVIEGTGDSSYFLDHPKSDAVYMWGYHQLHAVAEASRVLGEQSLLRGCRRTVDNLVQPCIRARMWYSYPDRKSDGVCAYCITPIVQGLASMYGATQAERYRKMAIQAAEWFYGRNTARVRMYDNTGRCRDGITAGVASDNFGAESAVEAGMAEMSRRALLNL